MLLYKDAQKDFMDIKYCNDCGEQNIKTAKFCIACRFSFVEADSLNTKSSVQPKPAPAPKATPKRTVQIVAETEDEPEDAEIPEVSTEDNVELISSLIDYCEQKGTPKDGVKFEHVVGTGEPRTGKKKGGKTPSAKAILKSTENKYNIGKDGQPI